MSKNQDNYLSMAGPLTQADLDEGEGVNRRIKMDINSWVRQVDDVLSNSRSKIVRENRYGISIGMDLLLAYLKEIAGRAIELEDEKLIDILLDLHVLKKKED